MRKSKPTKIKLLIDECVLGRTAKLLRESGFSVATIQELGKTSATNGTVISIANKESAIIVTNDLDFANLMIYPITPSHPGIIVLRPRLDTITAINDVHAVLIRLLKEVNPTQIKHSLVIIDRNKFRIRKE